MLIRLCYASTRIEHQNDLLQDFSDILTTARQFNAAQHIYGVLYYAEGHFFQCLEGEQQQLEQLFERIQQDPRHRDVFRFPDQILEHILFSEWSMKYVHKHSQISSLFKKLGFDVFLPHRLDEKTVQQFLALLLDLEQTILPEKSQRGYKNRGYSNFF